MFQYLLISLAISLAAHLIVKRYWLAVIIGTSLSSGANVVHEASKNGFKIRPADIAFWIPAEFFYGAILAAPVVLLVGLPFFLLRRKSAI